MQTTPDEHDELLDCRMAMLGLNLDATNGDTFNEIMRRCKSCGYREACAVDLRRDPNNPVWETYCPNTGAFIALAEARRNHETIRSLYKISGRCEKHLIHSFFWTPKPRSRRSSARRRQRRRL